MQAMDRMNQAMKKAPMTGDADHDFASMMAPHHQGAIDMAKAVIQYGNDPWTKELAQIIITAQEGEIVQMKEWLKANAAGHGTH